MTTNRHNKGVLRRALHSLQDWLKWMVARKELEELRELKSRIDDLDRWRNHDNPQVGAAARWLLNIYSYKPAGGAWGSISDFRERLRKDWPTANMSITSRGAST